MASRKAELEPFTARIRPARFDESVGPETHVTPDNIDEVLDKTLESLIGTRRDHAQCPTTIATLETNLKNAHSVAERATRDLARCDDVIRELREKLAAEEEQEESEPGWSDELYNLLVRLRGRVGLAAIVVVGMCAVAIAAEALTAKGKPETAVTARHDTATLGLPSEVDVPGLGRVRARFYRYSAPYRTYIAELEVIPDAEPGLKFLAVSRGYSSLTLDGTALTADPRARVFGALDLDNWLDASAKSGATISALRRQVDLNPLPRAANPMKGLIR